MPLVFVLSSTPSSRQRSLRRLRRAVGLIDDLLGITRGRNQGLRARTKLLASALVAIIFLRMIDATTAIYPRDVIFHAGTYALLVPHWLWLALGTSPSPGRFTRSILPMGSTALRPGR